MPEYPGGEEAMKKYLAAVPVPVNNGSTPIEGTVYIRFVIEKTGAVAHVTVAKGSNPLLETIAVAHIQKMPAWKPGYQNGRAVRVERIVPVRFRLE